MMDITADDLKLFDLELPLPDIAIEEVELPEVEMPDLKELEVSEIDLELPETEIEELEVADLELPEIDITMDEFNDIVPDDLEMETTVALTATSSAPLDVTYGTLDPQLAEELRATADRIRERLHGSIIESGKDLLAIKEKLPHGEFGKWLKAEFGWSERTAQNYMNAAALAEKSEMIAVLQPTAIYKLAAPSTPAVVQDKVIEAIESGKVPTLNEINHEIAVEKREEEQKRKQKEAEELEARRNAGKTPAQIKARKQRQLKKKEEQQRQQEEWRRQREEQDRAAHELAALVKKLVGDDFGTVQALVKKAGYYKAGEALAAT